MGKKLLLIAMFLTLGVSAAKAEGYTIESVPNVQLADHRCFVSNPDNLLSSTAVDSVNRVLYALRDNGLAEVAVVILDKVSEDEDAYFFAHNLLNHWGVGVEGEDNGLVLFASLGLRQIQIEVGYGLEGKMTDALCKRIIDQVIAPYLSQGDWDGGITAGVSAIYGILTEDPQYFAKAEEEDIPLIIALLLMVGAMVIFLIILVVVQILSTRCPKCKKYNALKRTSTRIIHDSLTKRTTEYTFTCRHCGNTKREVVSEPKVIITGGSISSGSSSFGGGFGGGMSGGGGARGGF
ncbi:MAG: TPM domain-containing protein [Rikenellaceae bacterium]|nr:TPM domain-containing protein [Rikenellaceae bacterium]